MSEIRKQWILTGAVLALLGAGLAFAAKIRPQLNLVEPGSRAPEFRARDIATDSVVSLERYRGKVVLLNVWATWCHPCRIEMPSMQRLHQRFAGTDFRVVAVSVDKDDETVVEDFVREMGLTFDVLHDQSGRIQQLYQTTGVPESFVIDRHGVIVKKEIGARQWDGPVTETLIQRLLDAR
ncbi:MAG TPA: TlpA disulfide reductase family protein [Gemmatimonadales bacterium]|nr:TlpA disulfide reductase family protein [Gemmatimonadales bacterium]